MAYAEHAANADRIARAASEQDYGYVKSAQEKGPRESPGSLSASGAPSEDSEQRHAFVKSAQEKGLRESRESHESPQWLALGHYRPRAFGGYESLVDDPRFFLHKEGKSDPEAELEATIDALMDTSAPLDDTHAACRYPARRKWLVSSMGLAESDLPAPVCAELEDYLERVAPRSATLVFPEAHMNSPASMFGHTMIRLDSEFESKLISHAINYAAFTDETFGPFYAVRGIFGMYKGYFSVMPYYERINRYSNMENRDIWEYRLNLTPEEVMMMALHVWEMREIYSYYYFFDENCSYILLFMLEVARPGVRLTEGFGMWAIPIDTIRRVKEAGLVEEVIYRPSRASRLMHISSVSTPEERNMAKDVAMGIQPPLAASLAGNDAGNDENPEQEIRTLDMATEFLKYRYEQQEIAKDEYTERLLEILSRRSRLGLMDYEVPSPTPPEQGHGSARAAFGMGSLDGETYASLRLRPAFHGLQDPDIGFARGASISFMDIEARYYEDRQEFELERLDIIDITSLAPVGDFFREASWKFNTGFEREALSGGKYRTPYGLYAASGLALDTPGRGIAYGFVGLSAKISGEMDENFAAGFRSTAGMVIAAGERFKALAEADAATYRAGHEYDSMSLSTVLSVAMGRNRALALEIRRRGVEHLWTTEVAVFLNIYY